MFFVRHKRALTGQLMNRMAVRNGHTVRMLR
jgi:hypothetical protein